MLGVLSIVPTKAAFCLMTNEQRNCFPDSSKMWATGTFTQMSVFTPSVVHTAFTTFESETTIEHKCTHWLFDFRSRIFSVKEE